MCIFGVMHFCKMENFLGKPKNIKEAVNTVGRVADSGNKIISWFMHNIRAQGYNCKSTVPYVKDL